MDFEKEFANYRSELNLIWGDSAQWMICYYCKEKLHPADNVRPLPAFGYGGPIWHARCDPFHIKSRNKEEAIQEDRKQEHFLHKLLFYLKFYVTFFIFISFAFGLAFGSVKAFEINPILGVVSLAIGLSLIVTSIAFICR